MNAPCHTDFQMEMSTGVSLLRTAQSLLTGRKVSGIHPTLSESQMLMNASCSSWRIMWSYASSHFAKKCTLLDVVNFWHAEYSSMFCRLLIFFSKSTFLKITSSNIIRVSNSLDPDQVRRSVGPDLRPNYLQDYQQQC